MLASPKPSFFFPFSPYTEFCFLFFFVPESLITSTVQGVLAERDDDIYYYYIIFFSALF